MKKLFLVMFFSISALFADKILLNTNKGDITLELFEDVAPKAVENFKTHVQNGYYDGTIFHRVIKGFMMQGGDPTATGRGGESIWGKDFEDEVSKDLEFDKAGLLAMANAGKNTNGSQFFITFSAAPWLNGNHTIFGQVVEGMETLTKVENSPTNTQDRPLDDIKIIKAKILKD